MKVSVTKSLALVAMFSLTQASTYPAMLEESIKSGNVQGIKSYINSELEKDNRPGQLASKGKSQQIIDSLYLKIFQAPVIHPELVEYLLSLKPDLNRSFLSSFKDGYLSIAIQFYYLVSYPENIQARGGWWANDSAQKVLAIIELLLQQPEVRVDATIKGMIEHPFAMITEERPFGFKIMTGPQFDALITPQQKDALRAVINKYEKK